MVLFIMLIRNISLGGFFCVTDKRLRLLVVKKRWFFYGGAVSKSRVKKINRLKRER